ncbi:MAG: NUDIX hydrolase [Thaumarchaeota archaeon]|nr:NUDIX hydrolase [Nitrososphaerota archaeon]
MKKSDSILLGKALLPDMAKDRWVIPASQLKYGEHPDDAAKRILREQLKAESEKISYLGIWSFTASHWDICFIYDVSLKTEPKPSEEGEAKRFPEDYFKSSQLLSEFHYFKPEEIRREQMGRGHDYVLEALGILRNTK